MMHADLDLERWRELWHVRQEPAPSDLRARVLAETRRMRLFLVVPVAVTIGFGGGYLARAVASPDVESITLAAAVWVFIGVAWATAILNSRGTWVPLADTTAAYLDVSIRRCRGTLRGLEFGVWLYVAELTFCLAWRLFVTDSSRRLEALVSPAFVVLGWVGLPAFLAFTIWYSRRKRQEVATLLELQRQLID